MRRLRIRRGAAFLIPLVALLAACHRHSTSSGPAGTSPPASAHLTPAISATVTTPVSPVPSPSPSGPARATPTHPAAPTTPATGPGPYTTEQAAEALVQTQAAAPFTFTDPNGTWAAGAPLHVLHATPSQSADYGGDYFYFFVNGRLVASHAFTQAIQAAATDAATYSVTYEVYKPGDPHCCPSGGQATVQFHWNGTAMVTTGSLDGATLS